MLELWKVMGRTMLDEKFLDDLLHSISNQDVQADDQKLRDKLMESKFRLSLFERGELKYWLMDSLFVRMLREIAGVGAPSSQTGNVGAAPPKPNLQKPKKKAQTKNASAGGKKEDGEFYAAVALALFDKPFRKALVDGATLDDFGFDFNDNDRTRLKTFIKDPTVEKSFSVLERLGWFSGCREASSFDPGYVHVHDMSQDYPSADYPGMRKKGYR